MTYYELLKNLLNPDYQHNETVYYVELVSEDPAECAKILGVSEQYYLMEFCC